MAKELTLPDVAKTAVWCGESLCIAIKKEYTLISYTSGTTKFLLPLENTERPLTLPLPDQQVLLQRESIHSFNIYIYTHTHITQHSTHIFSLKYPSFMISCECIYGIRWTIETTLRSEME